MKLCVRKSDGAIFKPSIPTGYDFGQAVADVISGKPLFYFKRVKRIKKHWWSKPELVETGEVWEPRHDEYDVIDV